MKTPEEMAAERQALEDEARRERIDLRDVLDTEAGRRVFVRLLRELGADAPMKNERDMCLRNAADWLLHQAAAAHPAACMRLLAELRGIGGAELLKQEEIHG